MRRRVEELLFFRVQKAVDAQGWDTFSREDKRRILELHNDFRQHQCERLRDKVMGSLEELYGVDMGGLE